MNWKRAALACSVAMLAIGGTTTSVASATSTNNPRWVKCNKEPGGFKDAACKEAGAGNWKLAPLSEGETAGIEVAATGAQKFSVTSTLGNPTFVCKTVKAIAGESFAGALFLGSAAPHAGTMEITNEYGECEEEGKPSCEINGKTGSSKEAKISTKPLKGTLVYTSKSAAEKELPAETALVLEPSEGSVYATITSGKNCTIEKELRFEGKTMASISTAAVLSEAHELNFKEGSYWENGAEKKSIEKAVGSLTLAGGGSMIYGGKWRIVYYWLFVNEIYFWAVLE